MDARAMRRLLAVAFGVLVLLCSPSVQASAGSGVGGTETWGTTFSTTLTADATLPTDDASTVTLQFQSVPEPRRRGRLFSSSAPCSRCNASGAEAEAENNKFADPATSRDDPPPLPASYMLKISLPRSIKLLQRHLLFAACLLAIGPRIFAAGFTNRTTTTSTATTLALGTGTVNTDITLSSSDNSAFRRPMPSMGLADSTIDQQWDYYPDHHRHEWRSRDPGQYGQRHPQYHQCRWGADRSRGFGSLSDQQRQ